MCWPTNAFDWTDGRDGVIYFRVTFAPSWAIPRARQAAVSFHTPPYDKMISPATVGVVIHGGNLVTCGLLPRDNVQANPQPQSCVPRPCIVRWGHPRLYEYGFGALEHSSPFVQVISVNHSTSNV